MNGYVESGYAVALVSLGGYAASIVFRQRAARRRLPARVEVQRTGGGERDGERQGTERQGGGERDGERQGGGERGDGAEATR